MKALDVLAIGEMLVDVIVRSKNGAWQLEANAGGAPANAAVCLRRLGMKSGFCGMFSTDFWGDWLLELLGSEGVDHRYAVRTDRPTTLAMVRLGDEGEREFSFYRNGTADVYLRQEHIPDEALAATRAIHVCSVSLSRSPAREATISAVERARQFGAFVSFDVNWRPMLWERDDEARALILPMVDAADFVKMSWEEMVWLFGTDDPRTIVHRIGRDSAIWIVTDGARPAMVVHRRQVHRIEGFLVRAVDTTGAGDAFSGAFLAQLLHQDFHFDFDGHDELVRAVKFAHATAALCVTRYGGIPALPTRREVEQFLRGAEQFLVDGGAIS